MFLSLTNVKISNKDFNWRKTRTIFILNDSVSEETERVCRVIQQSAISLPNLLVILDLRETG